MSPHVARPLFSMLPLPPRPSSATHSNVLHLCLITWLSHVVFRALQGQQVFSWVARTYMERHVYYTISYSKLACGIEKGRGARNGVWWYPKRLNLTFSAGPIKSFYKKKKKSFLFLTSQGSRRAQLQTRTSG